MTPEQWVTATISWKARLYVINQAGWDQSTFREDKIQS